MPSRDPNLFLADIRTAADAVLGYTSGMDYPAFAANRLVVDAVLHNLQIIGEAAGRLPAEVRARYPQVEWDKVVGFRNVVVHEYFGIDLKIVWAIVTDKVPGLRQQLG